MTTCKYSGSYQCPHNQNVYRKKQMMLFGETREKRVTPLYPSCPEDCLRDNKGTPCCWIIDIKGVKNMLLKDLQEEYGDYEVKEGFMDFLKNLLIIF